VAILFLVAAASGVLGCPHASGLDASREAGVAAVSRGTTVELVTASAAPDAEPAAEGEAFGVGLEPPANLRAGEPAIARVVVMARSPYHVNRDYPMSFRPDPVAVIVFGAERIALNDGAERTPCANQPAEVCKVSAPLRFTVARPGKVPLAGTVAFSVCNPQRCLIEKVKLSVMVAAR